MSNEWEESIFRTWIEALAFRGHREIAALLIDGTIHITFGSFERYDRHIHIPTSIFIDLPMEPFIYFQDDAISWHTAITLLDQLLKGYLTDDDGEQYTINDTDPNLRSIDAHMRIRLSDPDENWRAVTRELIANSKNPNQGVVTETVFNRAGKSPIVYNEMKFASQSEVRIAQELEKRGILFFPLPLAVRNETGQFYLDHREADFIVCQDGVWGILEVAFHEGRYEKDKEKDAWFKKSGILCIEHYPSEKAFKDPASVVEQFLDVLSKHKR